MKKKEIFLSIIILLTTLVDADIVKKNTIEIETSGELRVGAVQIEDTAGDKTSTLSLGGKVGIKSKPIYGLSTGVTFYTTNSIFGKDSEAMFLDSESKSYSIVGEAYIQANFDKTEIKTGRQLFESPFINGDDIGMIPNTVEGYSLLNNNIKDTTIVLGAFYKWSGIDTDKPEEFTRMQDSGDAVILGGIIYEGIQDTTLQIWQYKLEDNDVNYAEIGYENDKFSIAGQYSSQGNGDSIYGLDGVLNLGNLSLHTAYNKVSGIVNNGFGGGPFFTSSEDHTVHETLDGEARLIGAEYSIEELTLSMTHVDFNRGEDETDYLVSYSFNDNLAVDLIHSDMNHDGEMSRFFINYSFNNK